MGFRLLSRAAAAALAFVACQPIEGEEADNESPGDASVGGAATPVGGTGSPPTAGEPAPPMPGGTISPPMPEGGGARATPIDGGIITPRNGGRFLYSPGGAQRGHLPWPWTSGPTGIDVEVWDARGCRGNARIDVQVHGDVLVANGSTGGGLIAYGSDGGALGLWRPIGAGQGVRGFVRLPEAAGGGLAAILRRSGDLEPAIRTYDANGAALGEFEMRAPTREPIYDPERSAEPKHLLYVSTGEVLGDGGLNGEIHRWTVDGEYKGIYQLPVDAGFGRDTLGFALFPDGRIVVGTADGRALYAFDPSRFATNERVIALTEEHLFVTLEEPPIALGDTLGEDIMVVSGRGNSNYYHLISPEGSMPEPVEHFQEVATHMTPFREGYLTTGSASSYVEYVNADFEIVQNDDPSTPWRWTYTPELSLDWATGVLWLDARLWSR